MTNFHVLAPVEGKSSDEFAIYLDFKYLNGPPAKLQSRCVVGGILCHSKGPLDYIILEVEIRNDMTFPPELGSTVSEPQPFEDIFLIGHHGNLGPKKTNQDCKLIHAESELKKKC